MIGPVQFVAFRFDTLDRLQGQVLEQVEELTDSPAVRILDALFVGKEANGDLVAHELPGLDDTEDDAALGTILGALMGFSFDGEPAATPGEVTDASAVGISVSDIRRIGRDLVPDSGAALFLIEHRWATGLRDALRDAGGTPLLQGFLTLEGLALVGAELVATAEAIVALETADALQAEATLASLEALATIEVAAEVEAAVAARAVRQLVDAGFIELADARVAAAVLVGAELLDTTTEGAD